MPKGKILKKRIKEVGITYKDMCRLADVPIGSLSPMLSGRGVYEENFKKLYSFLEITPSIESRIQEELIKELLEDRDASISARLVSYYETGRTVFDEVEYKSVKGELGKHRTEPSKTNGNLIYVFKHNFV